MTREDILEKYVVKMGSLIMDGSLSLGSTEYLIIQLNAICMLLESKLEVAKNLEKQSYKLQPERLTKLEEMLDSERLMNAILTEELDNKNISK